MARVRWPALTLVVSLVGAVAWAYALTGTWFCDATCPKDIDPFQISAVGGMAVTLAGGGLAVLALVGRGRFAGRTAFCLAVAAWIGFAGYLIAFESARPQ